MAEELPEEGQVQRLALSVAKTSRCLSFSPATQHFLGRWIKKNIKKKECCLYVEDASEGICKCGYLKADHASDAIPSEEFTDEHWDEHKHVQEVPTDAFGDIRFGGLRQKTGKYVRVSSETSTELLYRLLTEKWKLHPPNLLISITGGAKNFQIKAHLKAKFRRGLIKVAESTGAWIITGGTHAGVMKHVGRAVHDYALSGSPTNGHIVTIGVATWGVVHNRQSLVHAEGRFPANYYLDEQSQGRLSCLDMNHSHFLLVDNGTHGRYGVEIELRSRLERHISEQPLGNGESGLRIPVVCVVLEGGPGTLDTIYHAMLNGTPCVILEGSGRIADIIARVAGLPVHKVTLALIHRLLKKSFGKEYESFTEGKVTEWTEKIQDIIKMPQLLTVFRINEQKNSNVDVAILQAFLKASRSGQIGGRQSWERQLDLAVAWNRMDIAKSEILTEDNQWKSRDLHKAMFSALIGHKSQFVQLLLENGVCVWQFLGEEGRLLALYTQMPSCSFQQRLVKRAEKSHKGQGSLHCRREITMSHVSDEVCRLLGSFTRPLYPPTAPTSHQVQMDTDSVCTITQANENAVLSCLSVDWRSMGSECNRGRDLFLWAIVQNQKELAQIAWEQCRDCIAAALAASKILKKLAKEEENEGEDAVEMTKLADHYEQQAIGVFGECHRWNKHRARKLLIRLSPSWGSTTCFRLALEADDKSFVAHSGVQALLTQIWCGDLGVDNPLWKVLLSMAFFPLIYTGFLTFRQDEDIQEEAEKPEEQTLERSPKNKTTESDTPEKSSKKTLTCSNKLVGLYYSPQVKFYWNILSYFGFLWLFAFVLMMDFQVSPSGAELLLYVWFTSLVCEEARQLFYDSDGIGFQRKAKTYISDMWNLLDMLSILFFIIGVVLRQQTNQSLIYTGKVILCIDFIIFSLRLMAIFIISKTMGPKIIIVKRMMMDLFFFMFLLSVWVFAYGVAKQGILIDNEQRLDWIIRGAVYEPYLVIFGNFPENIFDAEFDTSTCSVNATDPLKPKCPVLKENNTPAFPEWLTIIMLCVYLLFANILLLNLLIAIFNYTFQEVQDNTDIIWKFQRYELIKEYYRRPVAPPPFILLSHIYLFIKYVVLCQPLQPYIHFREKLSATKEEELLSWESLMKDNYLASMRQDQSQSLEHHVQETAEKVSTISEVMEKDQDAVAKRLAQLEEQVSQSNQALQWIMNTLKAQGYRCKEEAPLLSCRSTSVESSSDDCDGPESGRGKTQYHVLTDGGSSGQSSGKK